MSLPIACLLPRAMIFCSENPRRIPKSSAMKFRLQKLAERTRACNGVLYYVSLAERQVEVIADRGVMARIAAPEWQALVERFTEVARTGQLERACLTAIAGTAALLARHFPASEDAGNE